MMNGDGGIAMVPRFPIRQAALGSCPRRGTVSGELSAAMSCLGGPKVRGSGHGHTMSQLSIDYRLIMVEEVAD